LGIKFKLINWKWRIISEFKNSETYKYYYGSLIYIMLTGILINSFTSFYLNFNFTLEGIIGSGGIMFLIRYETIEFIRDLRKR